ncbi:hypothetical protein KKB18_04435 [bacterium]|nr:hypothetical protein [bacterium]
MRKTRFRIVILISLFILIVVVYNFFNFKVPSSKSEIFTRLENPNKSQKTQKEEPLSNTNFYANSEFVKFFEDVPCRESYLIYNYFSELKNSLSENEKTITLFIERLAEAGLFDKALQIANLIEDNDDRNLTLEIIIKEMLKAGDVEGALIIANSINDYFKNFALEDIVSYLAENGDLGRAIKIAESIKDRLPPYENVDRNFPVEYLRVVGRPPELQKFDRDQPLANALSTISKELLKEGNFEKALNIANSIDDWFIKVETLRDLAESLLKSGQKEKGKETFQSTIEVVNNFGSGVRHVFKNFDFDYLIYTCEQMDYIGIALANSGETEWAKSILERNYIALKARNRPEKGFFPSWGPLEAILKLGFYEWGFKLVDEYEEKDYVPFMYAEVAKDLSKKQKYELADILLNKAIDLKLELSKDEGEDDLDWFYNSLVGDYLELGKFESAQKLIDKITDKNAKNIKIGDISISLAKDGQIEKSIEYLDSIEDPQLKFNTLKKIAMTLIDQKNYDWFGKVFNLMLEIATSCKEKQERDKFFFDISYLLLNILCSEQQKYIQKFVSVYDMGGVK